MCHSWALATLATEAQIELEKQQVWTPLGLSDELTHTQTHTTWTVFQLVGLLIITTPSSHSHLALYQKTLRQFPHQTRWPWGKGKKKSLCQIRAPLPQGTQLITFAREEACPAQLWLLPLPSNNHDLHALPVRPLLLPATESKRLRKKEREKSNKRPQMGVGQHSWRTEKQRAFHIPSPLMMTSMT